MNPSDYSKNRKIEIYPTEIEWQQADGMSTVGVTDLDSMTELAEKLTSGISVLRKRLVTFSSVLTT